jgi:hypothetical protein
MRPIYETKADKANEQKVAEKITAARGYMMEKLARMHQMDYAAFSTGGLKAFIEIKCRTNPMAKYPTTMCGMDKVLYARQVQQAFGIKSYLFVQWTDRLGYICMNEPCELDLGGRIDRNDPNDTGMYAYFDISKFKVME